MSHEKIAVPDDLLQLSQRLEEWRSANPPRTRLPESIWEAAAEMAQRHGLHCTTKALRLDYMRFEETPAGRRATAAVNAAGVPGVVGRAYHRTGGVCGGVGVCRRQAARFDEGSGTGLG